MLGMPLSLVVLVFEAPEFIPFASLVLYSHFISVD